jgi:hypothetical protein
MLTSGFDGLINNKCMACPDHTEGDPRQKQDWGHVLWRVHVALGCRETAARHSSGLTIGAGSDPDPGCRRVSPSI